jgi:hypothetical protein
LFSDIWRGLKAYVLSRKNATPKTAQTPPAKEVKALPIKYPMLWLIALVLVVYGASFAFGYTELDDSIFIRDFHEYNEQLGNLFTSFRRGVFDPVNDTYYRPLFLDSMILNYQFSELNAQGYHIVNVLLHMLNVCLLYTLLKKLQLRPLHAFVLSLVFAVHPVLSQAVAWIPGRNDTMLAAFTFSFFICCINYANTGKPRALLLSALLLVLAFFTKETAVFVPPVAFVLLVVLLQNKWNDKKMLVQYGMWAGAFVLWYAVRAAATLKGAYMNPAAIAYDFVHRLPVVLQYLGKIFLPVNLSVFPILEDTVIYYGIAAAVILAVLLFLAKGKDIRTVVAGFAVFILFLLPVLLVPASLNEQLFEHRLYLPVAGILLVLSQTVLFKNGLTDKQLLTGAAIAVAVLAVVNYNHQQHFDNPQAFWKEAVRTSPHSGYANMMLAARTENKAESEMMMRKAYALDPKQKYINFYYGVMLQNHDSVQASEKYLLVEKQRSGYYECDFYLARVALERNDLNAAIGCLERFLKTDAANPQANNNLALLYINTHQKEKAAGQLKHMRELGLTVDPALQQQVDRM